MATGDFCEEYNCSIERKNYVKNMWLCRIGKN